MIVMMMVTMMMLLCYLDGTAGGLTIVVTYDREYMLLKVRGILR